MERLHSSSAPEAVITLTTATPVNTVAYVLMQTSRLTCWVVAISVPPSVSAKGRYESSSAVFEDLGDLPPLHAVLDNVSPEARIVEGTRNDTVFQLSGLEPLDYAYSSYCVKWHRDEKYGL